MSLAQRIRERLFNCFGRLDPIGPAGQREVNLSLCGAHDELERRVTTLENIEKQQDKINLGLFARLHELGEENKKLKTELEMQDNLDNAAYDEISTDIRDLSERVYAVEDCDNSEQLDELVASVGRLSAMCAKGGDLCGGADYDRFAAIEGWLGALEEKLDEAINNVNAMVRMHTEDSREIAALVRRVNQHKTAGTHNADLVNGLLLKMRALAEWMRIVDVSLKRLERRVFGPVPFLVLYLRGDTTPATMQLTEGEGR